MRKGDFGMSKSIKIVSLLTLLFILTSCWDAIELPDLAIIGGIGIDKTEEGEFSVSLQIANPSEVARGQEGAGRDASTIVVYTNTGNTLFEAFRKITTQLPRQPYFPHMILVVINEKLAEEDGLNEVMDWFERDHEPRTNANVLISRGADAKEILLIQPPIERVTARQLVSQTESLEQLLGESLVMDVDDVVRDLTSKGKELIVSGVEVRGDEELATKKETIQQSQPDGELVIKGIAMFSDAKLARWVEENEAKGLSWVLGRIQSTIDNVECDGQEDAIAIETVKANSDVQSTIENGKPTIQVTIEQEGNLAEVNCAKDFTDPEAIDEIEGLLEETIKNTAEKAIDIAQEEEADVFGFGDAIHRQHPKIWKQYEENWHEFFATLNVDVQVHAHVRRSGMSINSIQSETND